MELSSDVLNELAKELDKYPNVVGFSNSLQKRIRKGKVVNEDCIRIYVTHKIPERTRKPGVKVLKPHEIIPRKLCGFPVDIVETEGIPEILPYRKAIMIKQKQQKIRPLVAGISIGNIDISAGTLGIFMKHIDCDDQVYPASNAHVFLPFPEMDKPEHYEILQPGPYDKGDLDDKIGDYYWHEPITPMNQTRCKFLSWTISQANKLLKFFRRDTRLSCYSVKLNHLDFAVSTLEVEYEDKWIDYEFPPDRFLFLGLGFAGTRKISVHCKAIYMYCAGYEPTQHKISIPSLNEEVIKTGRSSCVTKAKVIDENATIKVNYGHFLAQFTDVFLTSIMLYPGDSGSAIFTEIKS